MTEEQTTTRPAGRPAARSGRALRLLGALALGISAVVHLRLALERPPLLADGGITLSGLFLAQAVAAAVVVVWVLLRGDRPAWAAFGLVAVGSLVALLASVYVEVPAIGPLPPIYEPVWYADKVISVVTAAVATVVAAVALAGTRRRGTTAGSTGSASTVADPDRP